MKKKYFGEWRIVEMEQWDKDYIDLVVPGYFTVEKDGTGSFHFGTVEAEIDSRVESLGSMERISSLSKEKPRVILSPVEDGQ